MTSTDPFKKVGSILKSTKYRNVLKILLSDKGNRIVSPYNSDLNHAWYLVGVVFFKQEKFSQALPAFMKSYRHWKEDIEAIRSIGTCYLEMGNPKTAKYYFLKARSIGGNRYKNRNALTYNLGNAYFDMGKYDLAISEYKKIRKSDMETYRLAQKNIKHAIKNK